MPARLAPVFVALLAFATPASAVTIDWVTVGNPGNADDQDTGFGAVAETYHIAKHEVTNAQYAEFLNAKAGAADPFELYNTNMEFGAITKSGSTYTAVAGREAMPVTWVSLSDAVRFANWLHNGQGSGDTETGAYTLSGLNPSFVTRNSAATIFVPNEDEWYKAAYHNAVGLSATDYFDYPAGSDTQTTCSTPTATPNRANCNNAVGDLTDVASYTGSASPHGTFDQGGNVWEWIEAGLIRGSSFDDGAFLLDRSVRVHADSAREVDEVGFRVASVIPEPGTGLLLLTGLAGLAWCRRRR